MDGEVLLPAVSTEVVPLEASTEEGEYFSVCVCSSRARINSSLIFSPFAFQVRAARWLRGRQVLIGQPDCPVSRNIPE